MPEIATIEVVFLLLLFFIVVFGVLAQTLNTPYPIVMVIGGLLLGFVPGILDVSLNPDLIFLVVLPPLLYASAWTTSWRDFHHNLISICFLAFGLVGFTVVGVAFIAPHVFPDFDWRLGLVLGAVVAPTDAIAASSIARRLGLPAHIVDILEGESLINDATGLLALQFAVAIVVSRQMPTLYTGLVTLGWLIVGGVGLGLLVGWIVDWVERRIDDGPIEITLSLLVPYAVYFAADAVHASGVLAVVTCGLFLGRRSSHLFSPTVRLHISSFWQSFSFVLNGLVFVLLGLQLPALRKALSGVPLRTLILEGAVFSLVLILLRLVWIYPGTHFAWLLRTRVLHQTEPVPEAKQIFVVGWTGMRGVLSLAAALALPTVLANGQLFPHRHLIVFLTFSVIVVTLVVQGLTLPALIRLFGLAGGTGPTSEEQLARRIVLKAAVTHLEAAQRHDHRKSAGLYKDLILHYRQRLAGLDPNFSNRAEVASHDRNIEISRETLIIERDTAIRLRNEGTINDEILRRLERELDLSETRFAMGDDQ